MARLTARQRKKIPSSEFAGPGRSFPIPDKAHAVAAERLVGRAEKAGSITAKQAAHIVTKAREKLHKSAAGHEKMKGHQSHHSSGNKQPYHDSDGDGY